MKQEQFLDVVERDEAERRFVAALDLSPRPAESVPLTAALGRVLAEDVTSTVDVPAFDRSNVDGYALGAADTFGATEEAPVRLRLNGETLSTGRSPTVEVTPGTATSIATGAVVPRGADAVCMVEYTDEEDGELIVRRAVTPGQAIAFAGTDIARGELVLHRGESLTSRETGVLAAIGRDYVSVVKRPRVAILSTGDEIVPPGTPMREGLVYDSNGRALADAVRELGAEPVELGIVSDDEAALRDALKSALQHDAVLLSGGTSKGAGDVAYRVLDDLPAPGVVAHGVALKPGKPLCLASAAGKPVVVLPGFPTSALFTFHEFVAPVIRRLAGRRDERHAAVTAELPIPIRSERGRTEYMLVNLVAGDDGLAAWPLGKGSGSVTTWSRSDGFVTIDRNHELVDAGERVDVTLMGRDVDPADFVFIGSHCVGTDVLTAALRERGFTTKVLAVGSEAGLFAAKRGECDVAGVHLLDPESDTYNTPFLDDSVTLAQGYGRMQGVVFRSDDSRFAGDADWRAALSRDDVVMVNRNRGSGTRVLIDRLLKDKLLGDARPRGHANCARTHNAVAAAVAARRADFGVAIETVADDYDLGFHPLREERYDFVIPKGRADRPATRAFLELLQDPVIRDALRGRGFPC